MYHLTTHLRLNAVYWGFTALSIMGRPEALDRDEMVEFVMSCWDDEAGICFVRFLLLVLVIIDLIFNDNRGFRRPP